MFCVFFLSSSPLSFIVKVGPKMWHWHWYQMIMALFISPHLNLCYQRWTGDPIGGAVSKAGGISHPI